jgi:hypothetical protein
MRILVHAYHTTLAEAENRYDKLITEATIVTCERRTVSVTVLFALDGALGTRLPPAVFLNFIFFVR